MCLVNSSFSLGFGLGLRPQHYSYIFEHQPKLDWFEVISENFMDTDGKPKRNLARIKELYPVVMHGVSMSIGSVDPLNSEYLTKLKALMDWLNPAWISDHLCWTGVAHKNTHDLLPLPYTEESLKHIVRRIQQVQDRLGRRVALENPSTYLEFKHSTIPEAEFIAAMAKEADCHLLLDINNVYVTCFNHRLDPQNYLDALPLGRVIQMHLSGHSNKGHYIVDTHDDHVIDEVWNLYKYAVNRAGRVPNTMIEWDDHIPEFPVLYAELDKAREAAQHATEFTLPHIAQADSVIFIEKNVTLPEAQTHMQQAVMLGDRFDSVPDQWIRAKNAFAPHEQLSVYANAYRYRLYDVVAEDYPVLMHYLTEQRFSAIIWAFVGEVLPDHFNIGRFALKLPAFIQKTLPNDVFAHALCQLETAVAQMTDPTETAALHEADIQGLTAETLLDLTLYPRQALALMQFDQQVNAYYQAVMDDHRPVVPVNEAVYLAVFRHEDVVWRMELEAQEFGLLSKLFDGATIGETLSDVHETEQHKITAYFSKWMRNGLLASHHYEYL
ncbi:DUF692 family multinuclear iron-containing protein [Methylophilus sp. UBA6697]|jgi:hypothetical protein|uniref:MNIO family bufferin maturase n=1 Tax=Methylophilus sp. UBA6697 TaxID=1946902 RepID=UPI000EE918B8|nr:DUF692 family multinuclear iron-containing protein [Methylophilus sp. UBA6697]HCU84695.1 DUF2063 domain-containing protein [Methylophilus sp.]